MPLAKDVLKTDIKNALANMQYKKYEDAVDSFVNELASAIDKYIKSGLVTVTVAGITTAGSPSAQAQVAPVQATGSIS